MIVGVGVFDSAVDPIARPRDDAPALQGQLNFHHKLEPLPNHVYNGNVGPVSQ